MTVAVMTATEAERELLNRVAASPQFQKARRLRELLLYISERSLRDPHSILHEQEIGVNVFGRQPDYDTSHDTLVRVQVSQLRKKLQEHFQRDGRNEPIIIEIPKGSYAPVFRPRKDDFPEADLPIPGETSALERLQTTRFLFSASILVVIIIVAGLSFWAGRRIPTSQPIIGVRAVTPHPFQASALIIPSGPEFYYQNSDAPDYTDQSGTIWKSIPGCQGGEIFHRPEREISGFRDWKLFQQGRGGQFQCSIPIAAGKYELHFLFAQTSRLAEAGHDVQLRINGDIPQDINVADEAAGEARVTSRIVTDVVPGTDGSIHIESLTKDSFFNALVILPGIPAHMRPLRYIAAPTPYVDHLGRRWTPDEFVFGGTADRRAFPTAGAPDSGLFQWERYGHFSYMLPVLPGFRYTVRLYFSEGWFGTKKWKPGGVGSRVFNVFCNGEAILRNFDILRETSNNDETVVKEFHNVVPTAQGKIELLFLPVKSYPLINAVEVEQEAPDSSQ